MEYTIISNENDMQLIMHKWWNHLIQNNSVNRIRKNAFLETLILLTTKNKYNLKKFAQNIALGI